MTTSNEKGKTKWEGKMREAKHDDKDSVTQRASNSKGQLKAKRQFPCNVCDLICSSNANRIIHMRIHMGEKIFKRSLCTKSFTQKSNLSTHINSKHTNKTRIECNVCQKRFSRKCDLKAHEQSHNKEKQFQCLKCNKFLKTKDVLRCHIKRHENAEGYKRKCPICSTTLSCKESLNIHMRTHTKERKYKCQTCDASFIQSNALTIHTRWHTGERPFSCGVCHKRFTQTSHLNTHK